MKNEEKEGFDVNDVSAYLEVIQSWRDDLRDIATGALQMKGIEESERYNLQRAIEHAPEGIDRNWFDGIKLVARQFDDVLQAQGVSIIPAVGERFDPAQHEAIASEETDEHAEGTIVEEMQPGYRLHNRVIRPTLVKVAHPRALKS